jgi:hypothetical protein
VPLAAMTMRSIERNCDTLMFSPPNFAVAPSASTRPRRAFSIGARLLVNFLEHEVRVLAARGVFLRKFQIADLDVAVSVPRFKTSKRSLVTVATS